MGPQSRAKADNNSLWLWRFTHYINVIRYLFQTRKFTKLFCNNTEMNNEINETIKFLIFLCFSKNLSDALQNWKLLHKMKAIHRNFNNQLKSLKSVWYCRIHFISSTFIWMTSHYDTFGIDAEVNLKVITFLPAHKLNHWTNRERLVVGQMFCWFVFIAFLNIINFCSEEKKILRFFKTNETRKRKKNFCSFLWAALFSGSLYDETFGEVQQFSMSSSLNELFFVSCSVALHIIHILWIAMYSENEKKSSFILPIRTIEQLMSEWAEQKEAPIKRNFFLHLLSLLASMNVWNRVEKGILL